MDLVNPPPARCDGCGRELRAAGVAGMWAGSPAGWIRLTGPEVTVELDGGRRARRVGAGWACRRCGHTVRLSRELPPRTLPGGDAEDGAPRPAVGAPPSERDFAPGVQTPLA